MICTDLFNPHNDNLKIKSELKLASKKAGENTQFVVLATGLSYSRPLKRF